MRKRHVVLAAASISVLVGAAAHQAFAGAYASEVSVSGSTVSFDLNESLTSGLGGGSAAPGDVKLILDGTTVDDLGALGEGTGIQTFNVAGTTDPNPTTVQVVVTTNDGPGYTSEGASNSPAVQIDNTGSNVLYGSPRSLAVDTNPADATFGDVFTGNTATNGNPNLPQQGIYVLNPDLTFKGANATEATGPLTAYSGGIGFSSGSSNSIFRLSVGDDGHLYITDWSSSQSSIYRVTLGNQTTPVVANSGVNVLTTGGNGTAVTTPTDEENNATVGVYSQSTTTIQEPASTTSNHTDPFSTAFVEGTGTNEQLIAVDMDYGSFTGSLTAVDSLSQLDENQIEQWNIGNSVPSTPPNGSTALTMTTGYSGQPTKLADSSPTAPTLDTRFWKQPQGAYPGWYENGQSTTSAGTIPDQASWWFTDVYSVQNDLGMGGPANQLYYIQDRNNGDSPSMFVMSPDDNKTIIWDSMDENERQQDTGPGANSDIMFGLYTINISADGRFMVLGQAAGPTAYFGAYVLPLLGGIPDLRLLQAQSVSPAGDNNRGVAFDPANNYYDINSGTINIREFGTGGTSVSVTGNNNTFFNGSSWSATGNGNISSISNWSAQVLASGFNEPMTFGPVNSAASTVNIDTPVTVGAITFNSHNTYTLSGSQQITISGLGGNLTVQAGNHTISAPVLVQTDLGLYAAAGTSLTVSNITYGNVIGAPTGSSAMPDVVKAGGGTVSVNNLNLVGNDLGDTASGNLDIYDGELKLLPNSGPAVVSELSVFNSTAANPEPSNASLDLANNDLIYDYNLNSYTTTSPLSVVAGLVKSGGITSSMAGLANGTGLAVAENNSTYFPHPDNNDGPYSTFDGQTVSDIDNTPTAGTVIVKYTYFGDLNFDGKVDSTDYDLMGADGPTTTLGWVAGDLNYDGKVNADDYSLFDLGLAAYNESHIVLGGSVPEPASLAMLSLAAIPMLRRRRA